MISAEDARKRKNELNTFEEKTQLEEIEKLINKDIKQGYTYYSGRLKDTVEAELKSLGYKTKYTSDQRDGSFTTISW